MEYVDKLNKIDPQHRRILEMMLSVNEVPEIVLDRYLTIRKVTDRVDARLNAIDLLRMAMDVGFDPETQRFHDNFMSSGGEVVTERPEIGTIQEKDEVPPITEADIEQAAKDMGLMDPNPYEVGQHVQCYIDGDVVDTVIMEVKKDGTEPIFVVEVDGERHEITELDIED